MTTQQFTTLIEKAGARAFVALPFDPNVVWGPRTRHFVTGTVNGCTVRGALSVDGTRYILSLGAVWRRDNRLDAGDSVDVVLAPEGPQAGLLAPDAAAALDAAPEARAFFEGLPTFYRKNYLRWIESAKRPETRAARIAEMVALLKAGKREK